MLEFSYRPQVFSGFYRGEEKNDSPLIEWDRDVDVLVAISSPLILVEKSVVKLQLSEAAVQDRYENNIYEEWLF